MPARAESWPRRPVTILVPFDAGGSADRLARGFAQYMPKYLGQPMTVVDRAGAGGMIAHERRAAGDVVHAEGDQHDRSGASGWNAECQQCGHRAALGTGIGGFGGDDAARVAGAETFGVFRRSFCLGVG